MFGDCLRPKSLQIIFLLIIFTCLITPPSYSFEEISFINEVRAGLEKPVDVAVSSGQITYVLDQKACGVFKYDSAGYLLKNFGGCGREEGQFNRPEAITVTPENHVLVADTGNNRIQAFDENGRHLFSFGNSGQARGEFSRPTGVATNDQGTIYVADSYNKRIQIFSPHGIYRGRIPLQSPPVDLAVDRQNTLYVLVPEEGNILIYEDNMQSTKNIRCVGGGKNYLNKASSVVVDDRGDIYITESQEHSIKKFDKSGNIVLSFGSEGEGRGQFDDPYGLTTDGGGNIYIADRDNKRLQVFQVTGSTKQALDTTGLNYPLRVDYFDSIEAEENLTDIRVTDHGTIYALSSRNNHILYRASANKFIGVSGRNKGELSGPQAIDYGPQGYVYVADTQNHRVQVFDKDGHFIFQFGQRGRKTGQFSSPQGVVVNSKGMIYVADTQNNRVQIFNKDGIFLKAFGEISQNSRDEEPADGTFRLPTALALDSRESLFVLDQGNNRIQIFDEHGEFLNSVGTFGEDYMQFSIPIDIAITSSDILVVADQGNHRVQLMHPTLIQFPFVFGSSAEGLGQFQQLTGVDVDQDRIYVTDARSNKIRIYAMIQGVQAPKKVSQPAPVPQPQINEIEKSEEYELR